MSNPPPCTPDWATQEHFFETVAIASEATSVRVWILAFKNLLHPVQKPLFSLTSHAGDRPISSLTLTTHGGVPRSPTMPV